VPTNFWRCWGSAPYGWDVADSLKHTTPYVLLYRIPSLWVKLFGIGRVPKNLGDAEAVSLVM